MTPEERREYMRKWREAHPDYRRKWAMEHADKNKEYQKAYYIKNRERIRLRNQQPEVKEQRNTWQREWWKRHKDECNAKRRERYATDTEYRENMINRKRLDYRKKVLGK